MSDREEVDAAEALVNGWYAKGWKPVQCGCCNGIQWGGTDPIECRDCALS